MTRLIRTDVTDTNLSQAKPDANVDLIGADGYDARVTNSPTYGGLRTVIKFGMLDGVPAGASIANAQLRMWASYNYGNTDGWVDVYKLTRGFDETTATWNRANATTTAWTTPGGDYDPTALSSSNGFNSDRSGSTGTSPTRCRAVMVLQRFEGLSDRETVERFTFGG